MTLSSLQPHEQMDAYPHFLATIRAEFPDDCEAIAEQIVDAELGDFCWASRFAERSLGFVESLGEDDDEVREAVRILGYFRARYLVATCILDCQRRLRWMPRIREFAALGDAEAAFMAAD